MRPSGELCASYSLARRFLGSGSPLVPPRPLRLEITDALGLVSTLSVVPCCSVDELPRGRGAAPQIFADVCKQRKNSTGQCGDRSGPRFVAAGASAQIFRCHARDHACASDCGSADLVRSGFSQLARIQSTTAIIRRGLLIRIGINSIECPALPILDLQRSCLFHCCRRQIPPIASRAWSCSD